MTDLVLDLISLSKSAVVIHNIHKCYAHVRDPDAARLRPLQASR
jgi:hypothetical protein